MTGGPGASEGRVGGREGRVVEPQEINAGLFYLRGLRRDERVDDLPALRIGIPEADDDYLRMRDRGWEEGTHLSWAVCAQTDVELLAEVGCTVDGETARIVGWARTDRPEAPEALTTGLEVVGRFAHSHLGLTPLYV